MSFPDTPDYTRGDVAAQRLLGTFPAATTSASVILPAGVTALWLWMAGTENAHAVEVVGNDSGLIYPAYEFMGGSTGNSSLLPLVAIVSPVIDFSVTITWLDTPGTDPWYVVGDTSVRVTVSLPLVVPIPH